MDSSEDFEKNIEKCMKLDTKDIDIDLKMSQKEREKIQKRLMEWLNYNIIRSISSVSDFMELLDELLDVTITKDGKILLQSSTRSEQQINESLKRNRDFYNDLLRETKENLEDGYIIDCETEDEELILLYLINTQKQIIEGIEKVNKLLGKFVFKREKRRYIKKFIDNLDGFSDSVILLYMRWIELTYNAGTSKQKLSLEMLEWDINTFKASIYEISRTAGMIGERKESHISEQDKQLSEIIVEVLQS